MLELNGGIGKLGVEHPEMYDDMLAWNEATVNEHADTVLALVARVREAEAEVERWKRQYPCDGGCNYNSGPEETCTLHGRPVREVWEALESRSKEWHEATERAKSAEAVIAEVTEAWWSGTEPGDDGVHYSDDIEHAMDVIWAALARHEKGATQ